MMFNYFTYRDADVTCPNCGWTGKGGDLKDGDYSEAHYIMDMDCPKCFERIGARQFPLQREVDEWLKDHPEWKP
jgi:hypothetical protein